MQGKLYTVILMAIVMVAVPMQNVATNDADELREGPVEDRLVIGFKGAVPANVATVVSEVGGELALELAPLSTVAVDFPSAKAAEDAIAQLQARDGIAYVEHDAYVGVDQLGVPHNPVTSPEDPMYPQQWGYPAIHAPEAWMLSNGSHDVKVATLDTGLDTDHQDLEANACGPFESFVTFEPFIDDRHGHGTHVSGTVAAVSNDGVGVAGTSQSCIMHGKVLSGGGWGYTSWVAAGVVWAADNGADVISMSLGGGGFSQVMADAVAHAFEDQDVLVVSAAGNSGWAGCNSVIYPAKYEQSMAVAALQAPGDETAAFSSCGPEVDIAAPGAGVLSTLPGDRYASWSGTSMATPHVAGVAALVLDAWPEMDAPTLRCVLYATSDDLDDPGRDEDTGFGRVNALRATTLEPISPENPASIASLAEAFPDCQDELLGLVGVP